MLLDDCFNRLCIHNLAEPWSAAFWRLIQADDQNFHILESSDSWPLLIVFHSEYIPDSLQPTISFGQLDQDKAVEMGNWWRKRKNLRLVSDVFR